MSENMETKYLEKLNRYVTAMRNEKPDCVPIRPFAAEFVAAYKGYTCQEVTHDYNKAFEATRLRLRTLTGMLRWATWCMCGQGLHRR